MIEVTPFFHDDTNTFSYVAFDTQTKDAVLIDPVLDFDLASATVSFKAVSQIGTYIERAGLELRFVLDTHMHADHLTGIYALRKKWGVPTAIGAGFLESCNYFSRFFAIETDHYEQAYDHYLADNQIIPAGSLAIKTLHTPGHTPSCVSYLIDDAVFVGDALFQPFRGCGRADFPGGSAAELFDGIQDKIYSLPDSTRIFVGHDYPADGRDPQCQTTVAASKKENVMITAATTRDEFILARTQKDKRLGMPRLFLYALQVNILGGQIPRIHDRTFLQIPVTVAE